MNDDTSDFELEAVSAYLDGTATPDERALVEASSALLAEVDRHAAIRDGLADVAMRSDVRERAIAAALAAFDATDGAGTSAPTPAGVIRLHERRRREYRFLAGAAAAVAIIFVGVAALAMSMGGSSDDGSSFSQATDVATKAGPDPAADAAPAAEMPAAAEEATMADTAPVPTIGSIDGAGDVALPPSIATPNELRDFVLLVNARSTRSSGDATTDNTASPPQSAPMAMSLPCADDRTAFVGPVVYQGVPAIVFQAVETGEISALAGDDCRVLVTFMP